MSFGARALIRLGALRRNLEVIRNAAPGAKVMAVIKANAYGHGLETVARHLTDADALAVARLPEAIALRGAGITQPIVLLGGVFSADELAAAAAHELQLVVHCQEQIALLEASRADGLITWLKFDTGMNRLGFATEAAVDLIARLRHCAAVGELRIMSHLASADELDNPMTRVQLQAFRQVVEGFEGAVSVANSAAIFGWPEIPAAHDVLGFEGDHWIRPGLAIFGLSPFADRNGRDLGLTAVMQFEARLIAIKPLSEGAQVGYKGRFRAQNDTTIGIISAGYGDGYSRHFRDGTPVLINGRRAPLIGNVSMDMIAVDLGVASEDRVGDIATLWGGDLPVEEVAPYANAIPYEIVCGVMHREAQEVVD